MALTAKVKPTSVLPQPGGQGFAVMQKTLQTAKKQKMMKPPAMGGKQFRKAM